MDSVSRQPLDWDQLDTVLLDMDGTLLDLRFDNFFWRELVPARYAAQAGLPHEEALTILTPRFAAAQGTLQWYCLDYWSRELDLDIAALKREAEEYIGFLPDVPRFLAEIRELRKRSVLVTNAHRGSLAIKLERTGLANYLDAMYSSHDLGVPKEDPDFWPLLQALEAFDPARTMLVDDSLPVLRAAHAYGICRVVAVLRPDSSQSPVAASDFHGVDSIVELLPPRVARGN